MWVGGVCGHCCVRAAGRRGGYRAGGRHLLAALLLHRSHPACPSPTPPTHPPTLGQAEVAGLERELELARRQIAIERRKQEEMARERERCACALPGWARGTKFGACHLRLAAAGGLMVAEDEAERAGSITPSSHTASAAATVHRLCRLNKARTSAENATAKHADLVGGWVGGLPLSWLRLGGRRQLRVATAGRQRTSPPSPAPPLPALAPCCRCGWRR